MNKFKPRPTVYKGIQMRSRLEAGFAAWLDDHKLIWEYEPCAFASEKGQYLPDFRVTNLPFLGEKAPIYFEIKPVSYLAKAEETYGGGQLLIREIEMQHQILRATDKATLFFLATPAGFYWSDGHLFPASFVFVDDRAPMTLAITRDMPWEGEYWKPTA